MATVRSALSEPGSESPLVGTAVTAHIGSAGPAGLRCGVRDPASGRVREALLPWANVHQVREGAGRPDLGPGHTLVALVTGTADVAPEGRDDSERLVLSAVAPELVERVLSGFVEEILTGQVAVMGVARAAGIKSKIAVAARSRTVEVRHVCAGRRASRIRGAERLLNRGFWREKLEIIEYSGDRAGFLANAMNPVHVTDVLIDRGYAVVEVEGHRPSGDIGETALDAELAGRLTGLHIEAVARGCDLRTAMDRLHARRTAATER